MYNRRKEERTLAGRYTEMAELAKQVSNTPGYTCVDGRAVNVETGKVYNIHATPSDHRAKKNALTSLQQILGWTPDLYTAAQEADRQRRIADHAARIPSLTFLEPTVSNGTAAGTDLQYQEREDELPDPTTNEATSGLNLDMSQFGGMIPSLEHITAEMARAYFDQKLDTNAENHFGLRNRHFNSLTVAQYANAMARGEWLPNPHGIMFSTDGNGQEWLIDGQQRMAAVPYAEKLYKEIHGESAEMPPVPFWVYRNVPPEMFKVVDSGRRRTISQVLQMLGMPNYTVGSSALRYVYLWFNVPDQSKWKRYPAFTGTQMKEIYRDHKGIDNDTYHIGNAARAAGLSRSAMVAAVYLIRFYSPEADYRPARMSGEPEQLSPIEKFVEDFLKGASLDDRDPVLALRNWAINAERKKANPRRDPVTQMDITMVMFHMMLIIRAWNTRVKGEKISNPSWRAGQVIPRPLTLRRPKED